MLVEVADILNLLTLQKTNKFFSLCGVMTLSSVLI